MEEQNQNYLEQIKDRKEQRIIEFLAVDAADGNIKEFSCLSLSKEVGIDRRTISKKIKHLIELGLVVQVKNNFCIDKDIITDIVQNVQRLYKMYNEGKDNLQMYNEDKDNLQMYNEGKDNLQMYNDCTKTDEKMYNEDAENVQSIVQNVQQNVQQGVQNVQSIVQNAQPIVQNVQSIVQNSRKNVQCCTKSKIYLQMYNEILYNELKSDSKMYNGVQFPNNLQDIFSSLLDNSENICPAEHEKNLMQACVKATIRILGTFLLENGKEESKIKKNIIEKLTNIEYNEIFEKENNNKEKKFSEKASEGLEVIELNSQEPFGSSCKTNSQLSSKSKTGRDPYKNKPYFSQDDFYEMTDTFEPDKTIKSPVHLFINIFWWQLWELYKANYNVLDYDEDGNEIEPDREDDSKMKGAPLPVNEILRLLDNTYQDVLGAAETKIYEDEFGSYKVDFQDFKDFDPFFIIDWKISSMPSGEKAMIVTSDRFRNIEVSDITSTLHTGGKKDKRVLAKVNMKFIQAILSTNGKKLSASEKVIKKFYDEFVNCDEDSRAMSFKGEFIMGPTKITDYVLRSWIGKNCSKLIKFPAFCEILRMPYTASDGLRLTSFLFSCEKVARFNELKGINDSLASQILRNAAKN